MLKNATGYYLSSTSNCWERIALVAKFKLFASIKKDFILFKETSTSIEVTVFFRTSKNSCCLPSQVQVLNNLVRSKMLWQPLITKINDSTSGKSLNWISSGMFTRELDKEPLLNYYTIYTNRSWSMLPLTNPAL